MTLKNEFELARYMATSLKAHANKVENGQVDPYRPFLTGATSVTISIRLTEPDGIIVSSAPSVESYEAEIKALQKTVKEQASTIQSLTPEVTECPEGTHLEGDDCVPDLADETPATVAEEESTPPKPKRTSR